jgi:cytochrome P450
MSNPADTIPPRAFPSATPLESLRFMLTFNIPSLLSGIAALRHRSAVAVNRLGSLDSSATLFRTLRAKHGEVVWIRGLSGPVLLVLGTDGLSRFFEEPAAVLALDAPDKARNLNVFEPNGVIMSHGPIREERRRLNDEALAAGCPAHPDLKRFLAVTAEEVRAMLTSAQVHGAELRYQQIESAFQRIARRCVLGDRAADDDDLTRWLVELRAASNWMGLRRGLNKRTDRMYQRLGYRLRDYAATAGPDTLVGRVEALPTSPGADPLGQLHHWFLALEGIAPVAARTLLALAAHPGEQEAARTEAAAGREPERYRACFWESLRLWPLVPSLLRVTRGDMHWEGVPLPLGTSVLTPIGFHQRDAAHVPAADRFFPERWLDDYGAADIDLRLSPFSRGPGQCPGQQLAVRLGPVFCAEVLRDEQLTMMSPVLDSAEPMPRFVDYPAIRLGLRPIMSASKNPGAPAGAVSGKPGTRSAGRS